MYSSKVPALQPAGGVGEYSSVVSRGCEGDFVFSVVALKRVTEGDLRIHSRRGVGGEIGQFTALLRAPKRLRPPDPEGTVTAPL